MALLLHLLGGLQHRVDLAAARELGEAHPGLSRLAQARQRGEDRRASAWRAACAGPAARGIALVGSQRTRRDLPDGARLGIEPPGDAVGDRRQRDEAGQEAQLAVGQMPPIEVHEYDGGQIEGGERQNAEDGKKEEDVAVGDDHRPPVGALELLDQEAGRGHEGHTEDEIGDSNEDTRKRHGLPHIIPRPANARRLSALADP